MKAEYVENCLERPFRRANRMACASRTEESVPDGEVNNGKCRVAEFLLGPWHDVLTDDV